MRGVMKQGLNLLEGEVVIGPVASVTDKEMSKTELWHRRLGHVCNDPKSLICDFMITHA